MINVIVVDDHEVFRKTFGVLLLSLGNIQIIAEACNGKDFLELLPQYKNQTDIVFMDIKMPEMNGIEATQKAIHKYPDLKIIALTMFGEEEYLLLMMEAGAKGFVTKDTVKEDLDNALKIILEDGYFCSEEMIKKICNQG